MRILVAGGSGFIGKHYLLSLSPDHEVVATYNTATSFPEFLAERNMGHVSPVQIDMRDENAVRQAFESVGNSFDLCFYAMGNSDIGLARREPLVDLRANVHSLLNLLGTTTIGKLIFMSSGAVYEGYTAEVHPGLAVSPTIPYSVNKLASELLIRFHQANTDRLGAYVNVRFFGAYGPMEPERKIYTNLIKAFVRDEEDEYTLKGNGLNLIDAMYIDDTIGAITRIAESDNVNLTVDLCYGEPLNINELVMKVAEIFGRNIELKHEGDTPEYTTFYASPDLARREFGFSPSMTLEEGMRRFADVIT